MEKRDEVVDALLFEAWKLILMIIEVPVPRWDGCS
jgi:hypothetical protein